MLSQLTAYHIIIIIFLLLINLLTYSLFYIDKKRAIKNQFRISEKTLLTFSVLGGGLGAWIGMKQFRHKTQKVTFKVGVPIGLILSAFLMLYLLLI